VGGLTFEDGADFFEGEKAAELCGLAVSGEAAEPAGVDGGVDGVLDGSGPFGVVSRRWSAVSSFFLFFFFFYILKS
jgi:hypothetical protein